MRDDPLGVPRARKREPIFRAPKVVTALLVALILVHGARALLSDKQDWAVISAFGLVPAWVTQGVATFPPGDPLFAASLVWPFVTHTFLHGGLLHLAFNALWLLALGTPVALRLGPARFLGLYFFSGALGALAYVLIQPTSPIPVIGASGAISGLMGGVVRFALVPSRGGGLASLGDVRLLTFVGLWFIINLVFGMTGVGVTDATTAIAWEAHAGGFIAGLFAFPIFDRAGRSFRRLQDHGPPPGQSSASGKD
jgi:membrane associated rhomboid family serine protease